MSCSHRSAKKWILWTAALSNYLLKGKLRNLISKLTLAFSILDHLWVLVYLQVLKDRNKLINTLAEIANIELRRKKDIWKSLIKQPYHLFISIKTDRVPHSNW